MATHLQDFELVKNNLKTSRKNQITALHKFIFEQEGDRLNRQRLREFEGFDFDENHEQYKLKIEYIKKNLKEEDLISICILLGLNYDQDDRKTYVFRNLSKGSLLQYTENERGNDEDEDQDDEEEDDEDKEDDDDSDNTQSFNTVGNYDGNTRNNKKKQANTNSCYNGRVNSRTHEDIQTRRFTLNFRDIEDSIKPFNGKGGISVEEWIQEFEETASMLYWDQLQMLIFGKKSLTGLAKQFVAGEKGLTSWSKLKKALLNEFKPRTNGRLVHQRLTERAMKKGEGVMEYLYTMKDIAAEGNIVEKDLILYVIDGIKDLNINKQMLYGAHDLKDFKEKIRDYEEYIMKNQNTTDRRHLEMKGMEQEKWNTDTKTMSSIKKKIYTENTRRCYNCGEEGHKSTSCRNRNKGTKCFKCNSFGHISRDCTTQTNDNRQKEVKCIKVKENHMMKPIIIENQELMALVDTGSHVNVMKEYIYHSLKSPRISNTNILLKGFGRKSEKIRPIGCIDTEIKIDDDVYDLTFCVVPDDYMKDDIIIGAPICDQAEVTINPEGLRIEKWIIAKIMNIKLHTETDTPYNIEVTASREAKQIVQKTVNNYTPEGTKNTNVTMRIVLTDETPIASRPRRLPLSERQLVEQQIEDWLKDGIIENSDSEFSSPIVLVSKKDGSKRLCVDYRRINKVIVRDRFPLPLIEDQLDRLQDAMIFSTIDLKNGFFHVAVEEQSKKYTAFVTHHGQYQFRRVPFGLANSPAVFQRFVNTIFRDLSQRGIALPYVDDIIIPGKNEEEAVVNLKEVLDLAKDYGLNLNLKKCNFLRKRIEFVGHVIENRKVSPSPTKKEAMIKYPVPKTLKQVESFLGLAGYFRKFIPEFAKEAKALSDLRKKDSKFVMGDAQLSSFESLKRKLCENPVLKIFHQQHETELHTDASADGYGAVLMQRSPEDDHLHPVHFMSRKTSDTERKYTSYELEILAVVEALKKFRVYLLGMKFKLVTDCNAFAMTMAKKELSTRVARWLLLLQEYDYTIEHRSGTQMRHVDALSRCMVIREESILEKIARAQLEDEDLKPIFELLKQKDTYNEYYRKSKVLYKLVNGKELLVVPKNLQYEIIKRAHEKGHFANKKTKELLIDEYYIPKLEDKIQRVVTNCIECIMINRKRGRQDGELHPLPKHDVPLHTYHVDHLGPLESTHKMYKHIFVIIDAFTKFCWLYATKTTTTKEVVSKLQLQSTVFGNPEVIISDRGTAFTSDEFQSYCKDENIQHHTVTTGLPRANGQVERLNATITSVLAKLSLDEPNKWYKWVSKVQQMINATHQRSIGTTPYELLIGKPMRTKEDLHIKQVIEEEMSTAYNEMRVELRRAAKQNIAKIQEENRKTYNLRRRPAPKYCVGELVAIKRTQYGGGLKLKTKYLGPYQITAVKAKDTYNVSKVGNAEGPKTTTTCSDFMKKWPGDDPRETQG